MIDPSCGKTLFSTLFHNYDCEIQESKLLSRLQKITEFRNWLSLWYKCWKSSMYIDHSSASVGILSQRKQATSPRTMLKTQPSPLYINNCSHWRRTKIVQNLMSPPVAYMLMVHLLLEWSSLKKNKLLLDGQCYNKTFSYRHNLLHCINHSSNEREHRLHKAPTPASSWWYVDDSSASGTILSLKENKLLVQKKMLRTDIQTQRYNLLHCINHCSNEKETRIIQTNLFSLAESFLLRSFRCIEFCSKRQTVAVQIPRNPRCTCFTSPTSLKICFHQYIQPKANRDNTKKRNHKVLEQSDDRGKRSTRRSVQSSAQQYATNLPHTCCETHHRRAASKNNKHEGFLSHLVRVCLFVRSLSNTRCAFFLSNFALYNAETKS